MIGLLVTLVIIGVVVWAVNQYVPMAPPIKTIFNVLVVIFVILWLLSAFGLIGGSGLYHNYYLRG